MTTQKIQLTAYRHTCLRCGESWVSQLEHPVRCQLCKSQYWSTVKTRGVSKTYTYQAGTRLSNAYTAGRDGLPRPKWCGDNTSAASKAWQAGNDEFISSPSKLKEKK